MSIRDCQNVHVLKIRGQLLTKRRVIEELAADTRHWICDEWILMTSRQSHSVIALCTITKNRF